MEIREKFWTICGKTYVGYEASDDLGNGYVFGYDKLYEFADHHSDELMDIFKSEVSEALKQKKRRIEAGIE